MVPTVSVRADSVQLWQGNADTSAYKRSTIYQNWATNCREKNQQKKVDTRTDVIQMLHEAKIIDEIENTDTFCPACYSISSLLDFQVFRLLGI